MSTASTPTPTVTGKKDLPLGTSPEHERLHRRIQRICWVLLIGLVVEGAFVTPFVLIWFGLPNQSVTDVCSGLQQNIYSDPTSTCKPRPMDAPPFGTSEHAGQDTSQDTGVVQPVPGYGPLDFHPFDK